MTAGRTAAATRAHLLLCALADPAVAQELEVYRAALAAGEVGYGIAAERNLSQLTRRVSRVALARAAETGLAVGREAAHG